MKLINTVYAGPIKDAPELNTYFEKAVQVSATIIASVAVLVIIVAGIMYMTSGGNEEQIQKSKRVLFGGIVGLLIALLSLIIVKVIIDIV
jgi:hypothetical protein